MKKILRCLSILFCFALFTGCGILNQNKEAVKLMELEKETENPTTIEELEKAISDYSMDVENVVEKNAQIGVWYKILASKYMDKNMYGLALESYQKAIEFYPQNQNLYYWVGVCAGYMAQSCLDYDGKGVNHQKINYYRLAESSYLQALKIQDDFVKAMYGLSVLYVFELDECEKAIPHLEKLISLQSDNTDAMMLLARAYYTSYEFDLAVETYDRIIQKTVSETRKREALENKKKILGEVYGQ